MLNTIEVFLNKLGYSDSCFSNGKYFILRSHLAHKVILQLTFLN